MTLPMLLRCTSLFAILALPGTSAPDSWMPFSNQRIVSESGRRYAVIKKDGDGITFELCERAAGAPPMTAATCSTIAVAPSTVERDAKDRLVAKGRWAQLPLSALVPDTLGGLLLFEKYAGIGYGKSVTYVDATGVEKVSLSLTEIFGEVPKAATWSVSSIWWNAGYWIDEGKQSIVVVAVGDELREISIADGEVTIPEPQRLLAWATAGTTSARALALEVLGRRAPNEKKDATPLAMRIFHDEKEPIALRLRAAVLAAQSGTPVAAEAVFAAARAVGQAKEVRRYAVRHLPDVLGEKAMPVLRELMRGAASPLWGDCYQAFTELGESAVPTLVAMVRETGESPDYRGGAAHALAVIKSPAALDALLEATATAEDYTANAACNAAIATGGEQLTGRLIAILAKGSTQDGRIGLYLKENPTRDALPAIEAALRRAKDQTDREWLEEARAACAR